MRVQGYVHSGKFHSGNCMPGNYFFRELSVQGTALWGNVHWELYVGEISSGNCLLEKSTSRNCPSKKYPLGIFSRTLAWPYNPSLSNIKPFIAKYL